MIPRSGKIDVLITVKTSPQPSTQYKDTVCVAGLYLPQDGPPEHVRLYPIPFRHLGEEHQFKKYEVRTFDVQMNPRDNRPESRKVIFSGPLPNLGFMKPWKKRTRVVEEVERKTMCEINRAAAAGEPGPSLGLVDPVDVEPLVIEETPALTREEIEKRERATAQQELNVFDEPRELVKQALEQPPLKAWFRYHCGDGSCPGHRQGILDWELTSLQRARQREGMSLDQLTKDVERNFFETPTRQDRKLSLFVGNQANPTKRGAFSVLGLYYPPKVELPPAIALFN